MSASLDLSRWRGAPRGGGYRRRAMVEAGLRQLLQLRIFKVLLSVAWSAGFALAVLGFVFAQSVSAGGWVESIAEYFGPRGLAVAKALTALVNLDRADLESRRAKGETRLGLTIEGLKITSTHLSSASASHRRTFRT